MGGAHRGRGGSGATVRAPRAGDAGGREGASWATAPPAHGAKGKGRGGSRARGGGQLGCARKSAQERKGGFSIYFPYFPLTISSSPLLSANFMESSKYSQGKLMCGSA
jgi:hypothetical protein